MRLHVFVALILMGIIPMVAASVIMIGAYRMESINYRISEAESYIDNVISKIGTPVHLTNSTFADMKNELALASDMYDGRIMIVDANLKILVDTYDIENGKILVSGEVIEALRGVEKTYINNKQEYFEICYPISVTDDSAIGVFIMRASYAGDVEVYKDSTALMFYLLILIVLILLFVTMLYAKALVRPIDQIIASIEHVSQGYLEDRVSIKGYYEIEKISDEFNEMLEKLNKLEKSRQEFVSNVSHELKTPMTSMKVLADSLLMQDHVPEEIYIEFLMDINKEIERENKIITDLLSLVKLDRKDGELNVSDVNINELLTMTLKRLEPIASKSNVDLVFESFRNVIAEVDEVKISQAFSNLTENAVKYNREGGSVKVSLNSDFRYFYVKVTDTGIGIPEDEQASIFERFYRVDKTRSRETGGTGLGLAITKSIIMMHKGTISVNSKEGEGTTFTVKIPLNVKPAKDGAQV